MPETLKIVIPMAGLGTRLRPHTWSKPKQLVTVAGKPVLDHVLDTLSSLPEPENIELVNIVGYLAIDPGYMRKNIHTFVPILSSRRSRSVHAIYLARGYLRSMLVVFADTLLGWTYPFWKTNRQKRCLGQTCESTAFGLQYE
jgi:glucose-1-phosphate thymidylyltransferase